MSPAGQNTEPARQAQDVEAIPTLAWSARPDGSAEFLAQANTVDYALVYEGEIWLELDDAKTIHLEKGDVVVQNGTRHAWRNKGNSPLTMLCFLNGARELGR